ncbi:protein MAIN-LIKE 1-like [Senna tora]|uniref:Protein MAIN-LIKE 1-like n=1 Tax=Senna tora TaxID=362788 RepID=A0A834T457_9FABA|nr:protein MAIN-LIKE 1-like [Senna tora]
MMKLLYGDDPTSYSEVLVERLAMMKLKFSGSLEKLAMWIPHPGVLAKLEGTGFEFFSNMRAAKSCLPLLASMFSFFDTDTSCFLFNNNCLCFGLEDIYYLTGLPIIGKAVIGYDYGLYTLCYELLGKREYFTISSGKKIVFHLVI